jgi:hypothetical protein
MDQTVPEEEIVRRAIMSAPLLVAVLVGAMLAAKSDDHKVEKCRQRKEDGQCMIRRFIDTYVDTYNKLR